MEQLFIYNSYWIGPGMTAVELIAERHSDIFHGQGPTRDIAIDKAFQCARRERRFKYPEIGYCTDEYFQKMWGIS